ncbi:MAG: hypothetical protein IKA19_08220 [Muribaculaceae bacterium]|nr:hypothetical protein [Muribaculaceae bacterium]
MIEISEYAYAKLLKVLSANLHISTDYGSPPIFYWYRRIIAETQNIENCRYLRRGDYKYNLQYSLGIAHVKCEYVGRNRVLIITNYDINTRALFSWKSMSSAGGMMSRTRVRPTPLGYRKLRTKPLFGYRFVINGKGEYNLIDQSGKLITQWFRNFKRLTKPYGKYQIIAYLNIRGYQYALGYDRNVYNMNMLWTEGRRESIDLLITDALNSIQRQQLNESSDGIIRINENQLLLIIKDIAQYLVA